jgi:hypothetical protein
MNVPTSAVVFRIVSGSIDQRTNAANTLTLLRRRSQRPPNRRAAYKRDELAPFHRLPGGSISGVVLSQTSTRQGSGVTYGAVAD